MVQFAGLKLTSLDTGNAWWIKSFDVVFSFQFHPSAQLCAISALQQLELQCQSEGLSRHTGGKYLSIT